MKLPIITIVGIGILSVGTAVSHDDKQGDGGKPASIRIMGSDTMLQMNLALADAYARKRPNLEPIVVDGRGSSSGLKALIDGRCELASSSRPIKASEEAKLEAAHDPGVEEMVAAYDPIAIFVHKDNPIDSISLDDLKAIYTQAGMTNRWEHVGEDGSGEREKREGDIRALGRNNSSGTYGAFLKMICEDKRAEYLPGIAAMSGSTALLEAIASDPLAIGYAPAAYKTEGVKALKIDSGKEGEKPVAPGAANLRKGNYALSRSLYYYFVAAPEGELKKFLEWIKTDEAKEIIVAQGFVAP